MNRSINKILILSAALFFFAACKKDAVMPALEEVRFHAEPSLSADIVMLSAEQAGEPVFTISWPEVQYPEQKPVIYSLHFALPADVFGANGWSNAIHVEAGQHVLSKSFLGAALNSLAIDLGLSPGQEGTLVVRVQAFQDKAVYSAPAAVKVTPYAGTADDPALWVAGDFQGWNIGTAPTIVSVNNDGIYEGYLYIPAGGTNEFKLYAQPDWGPMSYGDGGNGSLIEANFAGANFSVPSAGYYLFAVDLNNMTYMLRKTDWGIIGSATAGGLDADTPMTFDPANQTWTVTTDLKADGTFKFRANGQDQLVFGINAEGDLVYTSHPWRESTDQPQLSVPADGNYTITLDLDEPGHYSYEIRKN